MSSVHPAFLVNPASGDGKAFTFSFALGRQPLVRRLLERADAILARSLYRPFMRFKPAVVEHVAVSLPALLPHVAETRIVHLSDIHHGHFVPLTVIEQAVATANNLKPHVVFLTGDYVTNDVRCMAACARALGQLRAPLGVYAILGNHDYWTDAEEVAAQLRQHGITVLINESRMLADGLWVVGLDDAWSGRPDWDKALAGVPAGVTVILLAHEPEVADRAQGRGISLQLSGHSHGGQVRVPFMNRPVLPYLAWKYYAGLHQVGDVMVYTNCGLGTMQPPFIFRCQPQIGCLTLRPEA